ncbi:MAG TPA: hypothetical protein PKD37_02585 [Oligoflexia bacterium]|nr:hypothetical protein [Oligoflexia bacterium]HMP26857.1 hypothetical protein [Oligoflexia bacterium]
MKRAAVGIIELSLLFWLLAVSLFAAFATKSIQEKFYQIGEINGFDGRLSKNLQLVLSAGNQRDVTILQLAKNAQEASIKDLINQKLLYLSNFANNDPRKLNFSILFKESFFCLNKEFFDFNILFTVGSLISGEICILENFILMPKMIFNENLRALGETVVSESDLLMASKGFIHINTLKLKNQNAIVIAGGDLLIERVFFENQPDILRLAALNLISATGQVKINEIIGVGDIFASSRHGVVAPRELSISNFSNLPTREVLTLMSDFD